jgi:hypothetical protein
MPDHVASPEPTEMPEPRAGRRRSGAHRDPVSEAAALLAELSAIGVEVDGEIQIAESTWAVYGRTSYDGEIVVGEYHDAAVTEAVLRAAPRRQDHDGPIP